MSTNYSQYLGAKRCCDLKVQGPQGYQGAQGPSAVGGMGYQGATGALGYQGATGRGCRGTTGAQGYQGVTGPAGGAQGDIGAIGATGATGNIGPQGATGASQWISMNGLGQTGGGYTGIGITGQDVLIYGNLLVTGGIDPTYLALTPQPSGPQGFINPLWIDTTGNLRSDKIFLDISTNITNTLTNTQIQIVDDNPIYADPKSTTITSTSISVIAGISELDTQITNQEVKVRLNNDEYSSLTPSAISFINTTGIATGSSLNKNSLNYTDTDTFTIKDPNSFSTLSLFADSGNPGTNTATLSSETLNFNYGSSANFNNGSSFNVTAPSSINLSAIGGSITLNSGAAGSVYLGDATGNNVEINTNAINTQTSLGIILAKSTIQYPNNVRGASYNFTDFTDAIQTFTPAVSSTLTLNLFEIIEDRCGRQFIITNTGAGTLTVNSDTSPSLQLIYTTGSAPATTRILASGASHIFTAIKTSTTPDVYGWSMI
jgi:hypothetical protein